jgi:hypothetical protein
VTRRGTGDVPEDVEQAAADVGTAGGARQACEDAAVVYHGRGCASRDLATSGRVQNTSRDILEHSRK